MASYAPLNNALPLKRKQNPGSLKLVLRVRAESMHSVARCLATLRAIIQLTLSMATERQFDDV